VLVMLITSKKWRAIAFQIILVIFHFYTFFDTILVAAADILSKEALRIQLEKVVGVYTNKSNSVLKDILSSQGLSDNKAIHDYFDRTLRKTVLVTGCNHGFINHLHNFKCFADKLGMKFIVIAMDKLAYNYITNNTSMVAYHMVGGAVGETTAHPQKFRSQQFNLITARKKEAVHDILSLGYNVLFSDTDVAMIRDPLPYMLWENVDYVHSLNYMCKVDEKWDFHKSKVEGNTGFYFVRSNNNTIQLWANAYAAAPKYPRLDDQAVFWKVIRTSIIPPVLPLGLCRHFNTPSDLQLKPMKDTSDRYLVSCMIDTCVFSSGMISRMYEPEFTYETLLSNLKLLNETICTLHANYISGNEKKMARMKEYGFWLAKQNPGTTQYTEECDNYIPYELMPKSPK